jgi:uncharacterized phiE125 gp8 family phage protein
MLFHTLEKTWCLSDGPDGPADDPVTTAQAKAYCRFESSAFDADFARWISAARDLIERDTNRYLVPKLGELSLERFPTDGIYLERVPITLVDTITYWDAAGVGHVWDSDDWVCNLAGEPAVIYPAYGTSWPVSRKWPGSVIVNVELGYPAAADVPPLAKQIILFLVGQWFMAPELAGAVPPAAVDQYQNMVRRLGWGAFP